MNCKGCTFWNFKFAFIFFIVSLFFFQIAHTQKKFLSQSFVTVEEDITQYGITNIVKDDEGYLWITSNGDGLFKFNSIDFKNYKKEYNSPSTSLNSSLVYSILKDRKNRIWVGTELGINKYNSNLDQFEEIEIQDSISTQKLAVHAITDFDEDHLLLGTHGNGLYKFAIESNTMELIKNKSSFSNAGLLINCFSKSKRGKQLVGTNRGLMIYDEYNEELSIAKLDTGESYEILPISIQSMITTTDHSIWIGTFSSGVFRLRENSLGEFTIENFKISKNRILSLSEKSNGNILCGTENDGLFEIDYENDNINNLRYNKFTNDGLKSNSIWSIFTDEKDRVWLGYYNQGIDVYDENHNKFQSFKLIPAQPNYSLNSNSVTSIISDEKSRLWIGLLDGGIDVYDFNTKKFTNLNNPKNTIAKGLNAQDIQSVFKDSRDNIWVGTWNNGIYLLKKNAKSFININKSSIKSVLKSNRIMTFAEDSQGVIWIGTFLSGLYSFDPKDESFTHHNQSPFSSFNINSSNIRKIIVDKDDDLWLGTRSGVYHLQKNNQSKVYQIKSLNDKMNAILGNPSEPTIIFSLFEDQNNRIWIGSQGRGLFVYDKKSDKLRYYSSSDGFISSSVSSIIEDERGSIWIGGDNGLSKLNLENKTFTNFNKDDGLLSNNFNYNSVYRSASNELFFGNTKGINYFVPDNIIKNKELPSVFFTELELAGDIITPKSKNSPLKKVISKSKQITLRNFQSQFSLGFIGISYTRSKSNQYAYMLEGFDEDWIQSNTTRKVTYKNVPPGDYTFRVKAANNDGIWNQVPAEIAIKILPAWWISVYAIIFYVIIMCLLSYLIFSVIAERINQKRILNFERENNRQQEALNAKKIQFFTNISHEFRTPLSLILTPLEDIIKKDLTKLPAELREKHKTIYKNAKRLSRMINELMDFRKLQFNKTAINTSRILVVPFVDEVLSHFEEEAIIKSITLDFEYEEKDIIIWTDQSMLEKIIFNLLSNAFKATPVGGKITVSIQQPLKYVLLPLVNDNEPVQAIRIVIKDNGIGIKKENKDKIFDRFFHSNEKENTYKGGSGIGLELVKHFIELNKGKIVLKSKENKGSKFKIYLPAGNSHLEDNYEPKKKYSNTDKSAKLALEESVILDSEKDFKNKKIALIVEDNYDLRNYIKNELKNEYQIKEADDGKKGIEMACKYIPDIIITDVMMPSMDGFEFCHQIKNDIKTSHIPILMVTAKSMEVDRLKGIDSGADVYLNKPFSMDVLKSHLKQLIKSRQILFDKYFNGIVEKINTENSTSLDKEFINSVIQYINENISDESLNVGNLAGQMSLSRSKLYRKIKSLTGDTANEFIRKVRLKKAKQLLKIQKLNVSEVTYKVGFSSPSYFTKCFKDHYGVLPTRIKEKDMSE
ncbi:MAG: two-component regulator propeller domain-containing protein [Flavobacteriaceae bacterium]